MLTLPDKRSQRTRIDPELSERMERRRKIRRKAMQRRMITLALIAVVIFSAAVIIVSALKRGDTEAERQIPDKVYTTYWNTQIEVDPRYPASELLDSGFVTVGGRKKYLSGTVKSCAGIDVSEHNGEIDWEAAAADGIEFAMIRVGYRGYTEGDVYEDERFEKNYQGAKAAGLKVGAYFFSQAVSAEEAAEEAELALKALKGHPLDLPLAYDWETIGDENARADDIDCETLTACTQEFCRKVSKKYDAMIYTNAYQGYYLLSLGELSEYPVWFAGYAETPVFYYRYDIWQYTNKGVVAGIEGDVDLNILFYNE